MTPPKILLITPFRNEAHSLPHYLTALYHLEYPPELIDTYWLENDSTDNTLEMLRSALNQMPFRKTVLQYINLIGGAKKRAPGEYCKDMEYTVSLRSAPWMQIWNDYFLPRIRKSKTDYVLMWYADSIPPANVVTEYLEVFKEKHDAGWVGGGIYRRRPREKELRCPIPTDKAYSDKVEEVTYISHCWMMPREAAAKLSMWDIVPQIMCGPIRDIHMSLIEGLKKQELRVYYQPSVFLQHVSTDGIIYTKSLE